MAAIHSYRASHKILILEKMRMPAVKLRLSGKGRCNITNDAELPEFISHFGKNGRFLKFAFSEFFNQDLLIFFSDLGVQFKLERGGRYFPESDKATEIVEALLGKLKAQGQMVTVNSEVKKITKKESGTFLIDYRQGDSQSLKSIESEIVLIATGGKSYPKTGSTGAGYVFADNMGHSITSVSPSLVPVETAGELALKLQGLSLRNVAVSIWVDGKKVDEQFGEMVFTDFGVSGPAILTLSRTLVKLIDDKRKPQLIIDLKPALDHKKVDQRILREINQHGKQNFKTLLKDLLPRKMIAMFCTLLEIDDAKPLNQLSAAERKRLRLLLKEFRLDVTGYRGYNHAIVTSGGVKIKEVNPMSMESRLVEGLFFAGEVLDIDADTGGYNLQAAFSTGWLAGRSIKTALLKKTQNITVSN